MASQNGMSFYRKGRYLQEQQRLTKYAPRIFCRPHIRDIEELSRVALYPDHVDENGSLKVEGISRKDLTEKGFSIFRKNYTSRATINNFVAQQIERKPARNLKYVLSFLAGKVRAINDAENHQAFVIIDDAPTESLTGHALILCAEKHTPSKIKELRHTLYNIINNPVELNKAYPETTYHGSD